MEPAIAHAASGAVSYQYKPTGLSKLNSQLSRKRIIYVPKKNHNSRDVLTSATDGAHSNVKNLKHLWQYVTLPTYSNKLNAISEDPFKVHV